MGKKKIIKLAIVGASFFTVLLIVMFMMGEKKQKQKNISQCEEIVKNHIEAINSKKISMYDYETNCSLKSIHKYKEYNASLTKDDVVYYKNVFEEKYQGDMEYIEKCVGKDFEITYIVNNIKDLDRKRIKFIEYELEDYGKNPDSYFRFAREDLAIDLSYFDIEAERIEKNDRLIKVFLDELAEIDIDNAYKFDVKFNIKGNKEIEFDMEVYFAEINDEIIMISYEPEEPEEDPEHFGLSDGINPTVIANEIDRYSEYDWIDRGESVFGYYTFGSADVILERYDYWLQKDGDGNRICFKYDEELSTDILEYVDANGTVISGYEGINYITSNGTEHFIYVYSDYDKEKNEYSGLKKVISFFFCNGEKLVLGIDDKEVEFIYESTLEQ